jgi:hypothetical protein
MNLISIGNKVISDFPERQYILGEYVAVYSNWNNKRERHDEMRIVKILDGENYHVQCQNTGDIYEANVKDIFINREYSTRHPMY